MEAAWDNELNHQHKMRPRYHEKAGTLVNMANMDKHVRYLHINVKDMCLSAQCPQYRPRCWSSGRGSTVPCTSCTLSLSLGRRFRGRLRALATWNCETCK